MPFPLLSFSYKTLTTLLKISKPFFYIMSESCNLPTFGPVFDTACPKYNPHHTRELKATHYRDFNISSHGPHGRFRNIRFSHGLPCNFLLY